MTRLAGAPISWGVCEVRDWGYQMPAKRVLAEIREAGLRATELGPPGYFPADPRAVARLLDAAGLELAAGFVSPVLHRPELMDRAIYELTQVASAVAGAGGHVLVVAAAAGSGYDARQTLDQPGWSALLAGLSRAQEIAGRHDLDLAFHPHAGTVVESAEDVGRLLELSDVGLCLDTGHLLLGGVDTVQLAATAGSRVRHVHLKDVDGLLASRVQSGDLAYSDAVRRGLFKPLGTGVVDVRALVSHFEAAGYRGWYVLEQDVMLTAEPRPGMGPVRDVRRSVVFFESLVALKTKREM